MTDADRIQNLLQQGLLSTADEKAALTLLNSEMSLTIDDIGALLRTFPAPGVCSAAQRRFFHVTGDMTGVRNVLTPLLFSDHDCHRELAEYLLNVTSFKRANAAAIKPDSYLVLRFLQANVAKNPQVACDKKIQAERFSDAQGPVIRVRYGTNGTLQEVRVMSSDRAWNESYKFSYAGDRISWGDFLLDARFNLIRYSNREIDYGYDHTVVAHYLTLGNNEFVVPSSTGTSGYQFLYENGWLVKAHRFSIPRDGWMSRLWPHLAKIPAMCVWMLRTGLSQGGVVITATYRIHGNAPGTGISGVHPGVSEFTLLQGVKCDEPEILHHKQNVASGRGGRC